MPRTRALDATMITTNPAIDGYRVVKSLGIVRGVTVRSRSIFVFEPMPREAR